MIMGHVGDKACSGKKPISPGHMGNTAFLPGQKTHVTIFGALSGLAFDSTYDIINYLSYIFLSDKFAYHI